MLVSGIDIDSIGTAFEHFFSSVFRGELGQYFTRRELVRFVCAALSLTDDDRILDPTAGSGGFLLEAMVQVWSHINSVYAGQPEVERRRIDFARNNLFAIEINRTLGHVCQANLLIHKDGHTNVEVDRSCLDVAFERDHLDPARHWFTAVVGNPPFGDRIRRADYGDHLGSATPSDFALFRGGSVASEKLILERS